MVLTILKSNADAGQQAVFVWNDVAFETLILRHDLGFRGNPLRSAPALIGNEKAIGNEGRHGHHLPK